MRYYKKPEYVEAHQWFKNGDHPHDYDQEKVGFENGELRTWTGAEVKENGWEGQVVGYFRHPYVDGNSACIHCPHIMHDHGWIDGTLSGETVCPGDYILTLESGEYRAIKPEIFERLYIKADA